MTVLLVYPGHAQSQIIVNKEVIQSIDSLLMQEEKTGFSGSVLISENNNILWAEGYGLADRERKLLNDKHTIFEIASITKLFTAVSILQLAERGRLAIHDPISNYLGDFKPPKDQATVHHLLLHVAGLVPRGYELDYDSRSGFVESVKNAPAESIPGEEYRYTNAGYTLLAAIIEEVGQMSYEEYLVKYIFNPLNLTHTTFGYKDSMTNVAKGYAGDSVDSLRLYETGSYVWGDRGPSGILTNVSDLHTFLKGLDDNTLLKEELQQKMFFEQMPGEAYGFHILDRSGIGRVLARGGGMPHFESQIAWYRDHDIMVIILMNNHIGKRLPVWNGIEKLIFN